MLHLVRSFLISCCFVMVLLGTPASLVQGQLQQATNASSPPRVWFETSGWHYAGDPIVVRFDNGAGNSPAALNLVIESKSAWQNTWQYLFGGQMEMGQTQYEFEIWETDFRLRARVTNPAGVSSGWVVSDAIRRYATLASIRYADHRGRTLPPIDPKLPPQGYQIGAGDPPWYWIDPAAQRIYAYLSDTSHHQVVVQAQYPGYGWWGPVYLVDFYEELADAPNRTTDLTVYLPPLDNLMAEPGPADRALWEIQGSADMSLLGTFHIVRMRDDTLSTICPLWEFIEPDIGGLNQPALGLYYKTNIPHLRMAWQAQSGGDMQPIQTLSPAVSHWQYAWLDMSAVADVPGRICFLFHPEGVNNAFFNFDSMALGSTRSSLSVRLHSAPLAPQAGEGVALTFSVANHSPYPASGRLTLTATGLAVPAQRRLPALAAGATDFVTFTLAMPANGDPLVYRAQVGKPDIDDTPDDNIYQSMITADPLLHFFPVQLSVSSPTFATQR